MQGRSVLEHRHEAPVLLAKVDLVRVVAKRELEHDHPGTPHICRPRVSLALEPLGGHVSAKPPCHLVAEHLGAQRSSRGEWALQSLGMAAPSCSGERLSKVLVLNSR